MLTIRYRRCVVSKDVLHNLIDMIPEADSETIFKVLLKFIPSDVPSNDEIVAISKANESITRDGTVVFDDVNW